MELKNTIIKSVTALVCIIALCVTAVINTNKICDATKESATAVASGDESVDPANGDNIAPDDATPADDGTVAEDTTVADDTATVDDTATADDTTVADNAATDAGTKSATKTTTKTATGSKAPSSTADIVAYYNTATAKAVKSVATFTKSRTTTEKSFDAGAALSALKSTVYKFMGTGDANKFSQTVTKADKDSYHKYLQASKLTTSDVTSAKCVANGSNYTITLNIKNGSSKVTSGKVVSSNNAPLDRSGLACGDNDKDYWDHKTAENVMSAIDEVPGCTKANISESYSNAVIVAVINSTTGNLVSIKASFNFKFELSSVMASKGTAEAQTIVNMTNFKF